MALARESGKFGERDWKRDLGEAAEERERGEGGRGRVKKKRRRKEEEKAAIGPRRLQGEQ